MIPPRLVRSLVALVLVTGMGALAPIAIAQEGRDDQDRPTQQELREAIGHASVEEMAALAQLEDVRARRVELEATARRLEAQIAAAADRQETAQREVDRIGADIAVVQREIDRLQAEIDASRDDFEESAVTLYRNAGGGGEAVSVLKFVENPRESISAQRYLRQLTRDAQAAINAFGALQDDVDVAKQELEAQQALADQARAEAEAERVEVERLRAEHEPVRAAAEDEEARESEVLASVRARKQEFEAQLAALQAEQAAMAQGVSRGSGNGQLKWPCDGAVSSGYGYRVHPISGTSRMHTGVDIGCSNGAPISTAGGGVVLEVGPRGGYGNTVLVDHGDGLATLYAHQSRTAASPGDRVSTGDVIGYVGSTGYSTGPHLHWEVWVNGNPVDPMGYT